jgi:uncharacterized membrane protein
MFLSGKFSPNPKTCAASVEGSFFVNLNQLLAQLVRAAEWQLMRRSPTWMLLGIVLGAVALALLKH